MQLLIDSGVEVNKIANDGYSALCVACQERRVECVRVLVSGGADMHQSTTDLGIFPLFRACCKKHADIVDLLVDSGANVNQATFEGDPSLMAASETGNTNIVKKLISAGADLNHKRKDGDTSLHVACHKNNFEVAQILIDAGCNVDLVNDKGATPFFVCCGMGFTKIAELLIKNGCDIEKAATKDGRQWTPLQIANNNTDIADLITAEIKRRKKRENDKARKKKKKKSNANAIANDNANPIEKVEEKKIKVPCCSSCRKVPSQDVKLLKCSACRSSQYCNIRCQKAHSPTHKISCEEKNLFRVAMEKRQLSAAVSEVEELNELEVEEDNTFEDSDGEIVIDMTKTRLLPVDPVAYGDNSVASAHNQEVELIDMTGDYNEDEDEEEDDNAIADGDRKKSPPAPTLHETEECVVCLGAKKTTLLLPCKHYCLCSTCSENVTECPLCKMEVTDKMEIYC